MGLFSETMQGLAKAAPRFPGWGGGAGGGWGGWGGGSGSRTFRGPWDGNGRDWSKLVGDGSGSSIVEACVLWMCRNFSEAPLVVYDETTDVPEIVHRHKYPRFERRPNPFYSGVLMNYGTLASMIVDGNAYKIKVRDQLDRVVEKYYAPHWMLNPRWPSDGSEFISWYDYNPNGTIQELQPRDVEHLRYGIDPNNTRKGRSPLRTLFEELGVDKEASRFTASLLVNLGVPGVVMAPAKDSPKTIGEQERKAIKDLYKREFGGDNRGGLMVMSRALNLTTFGFSPDEMNLSAIRDIPEERVTAVLGIPAAVVGFQQQNSKVGATRSEERVQAQENCLIPLRTLMAAEQTIQALPDFASEAELENQIVGYDLTRVRALSSFNKELADQMSTMVRANIIEIAEARAITGFPVRTTDHVFAPSPGVTFINPDGSPTFVLGRGETVVDPNAPGGAFAEPKPTQLQPNGQLPPPQQQLALPSGKDLDRLEEMLKEFRQVLANPPKNDGLIAATIAASAETAAATRELAGAVSHGSSPKGIPRKVVKRVDRRDTRGQIVQLTELTSYGKDDEPTVVVKKVSKRDSKGRIKETTEDYLGEKEG